MVYCVELKIGNIMETGSVVQITLEKLIQDVEDDKEINLTRGVCSIARTLISDMPLKVDGYANPVSSLSYMQMTVDKPGLPSIVDPTKVVLSQDIIQQVALYDYLRDAQRAVLSAIQEGAEGIITFFQKTPYDGDTLIYVGDNKFQTLYQCAVACKKYDLFFALIRIEDSRMPDQLISEKVSEVWGALDLEGKKTVLKRVINGTNVLYSLCRYNPQIIEVDMIDKVAINRVIAQGPGAGVSALYLLVFWQSPLLAELGSAMIDKAALNSTVALGPNAGHSVLYWLACAPEGREFLASLDRAMIDGAALNTVITQGPRAGESALYWLACTSEGRTLLAGLDPAMIEKATLNTMIAQGPNTVYSALYGLACTPEGRALLASLGSSMIDEVALNTVIAKGPCAGYSALYVFACTPEGQALLASLDPAMIENATLNSVITQGPNSRKSARSILFETSEGNKLLRRFDLHNSTSASVSIFTSTNKPEGNSSVSQGGHKVKKRRYE